MRKKSSDKVNRLFKWLAPGLFVKRWLLISTSGLLLTLLGGAIWVKLTPIYRILSFISEFFSFITNVVPNYISGPLVILFGLALVLWGQSRTVGSITDVLLPDRDEELVDMLLAHRRLNKGPKITLEVNLAPMSDHFFFIDGSD